MSRTKQKSVEGGISGLFITCEGQEKRALIEAYNLIDEVLGEPKREGKTLFSSLTCHFVDSGNRSPSISEEEDIADSIKKACTEAKIPNTKVRRCRQRPTGVKKCLFVSVKGLYPVRSLLYRTV